MNFDFDEQQYQFRETFARFLVDAFPLASHDIRVAEGLGAHDATWAGLSELGLFALLTPEEHGGLGLGFVDLALIVEELGRALAPLSITDTLVATDVIARFAPTEVKAALLPRIASGDVRVALATLEPDAGYHLRSIASTATQVGGELQLAGRKMLVPHALEASVLLVTVRDPDGDVRVALVDANAGGVTIRGHNSLDPSCASSEVVFDRTPLGAAWLLEKRAAERLFDASAGVAALLQMGVAGKMLDLAVDYARTRVQFGKPIGSFQAIKHRCADMAVAHDAGRAAAYYASWALAEDAPDRARAVSVAKAFCGDAARMICNEGIQVHGGMGFTWELGLHHYLRRSKVLEHAWGDGAFHRERALSEMVSSLNLDDGATCANTTAGLGGSPCKSAA